MANVREIDNNDDIYIGVEFPLDFSVDGFLRKTKTIRQQVKSNIKNLILTSKGERVFQPNFGSNLKSLLFEQITNDSLDSVDTDIRVSLSTWLPYVNVEELIVQQDSANENKVVISLEYSTSLNPDIFDTLTFTVEQGV
jgi:phage baseplate assembly protein W|tara:strand:+ start:22 stop:438 length:417 start_codon:yes stop_codon:yes gene_type:complete